MRSTLIALAAFATTLCLIAGQMALMRPAAIG